MAVAKNAKDRCFPNEAADYDDRHPVVVDGQLQRKLKTLIGGYVHSVLKNYSPMEAEDPYVYTGAGGVALAFLRLWQQESDTTQKRQHMASAWDYLLRSEELVSSGRFSKRHRHASFLTGDAGIFAIGAYYAKLSADTETCDHLIQRLRDLLPAVSDPQIPDEVLFGRSGYLYACLFVNKHVSPDSIPPDVIEAVFNTIIHSGVRFAHPQCPLMYEWHETKYLGAAHGLAGILHTLMSVPNLCTGRVAHLVRSSVDYILSTRFDSGNFPSSDGKTRDELVHWCHGAPGHSLMFLKAYQFFKDARYLRAASEAADVVWARGLVKKGPGLCHGLAGNGYVFLSLYGATKEPMHLHRAIQFALFAESDDFKTVIHNPDHPLSLFEGLAGLLVFLSDVAYSSDNPAGFPGMHV